ncbi:MAG: hypothetical protein ACRCWG_10165 [Sarcina sp.]
MIKTKVISLAMAGIVGVGGTVALIQKIDWNGKATLTKTSTNVETYVQQTNVAMQKSEAVIEKQNEEIKNLKSENSNLNSKITHLNTQLNDENEMISSLNKVIATLNGSTDYKHMTVAQKKKTLNNLLKDWGYGNMSISIADKIFSWTDGWGLYQVQGNNSTNKNTITKVDQSK